MAGDVGLEGAAALEEEDDVAEDEDAVDEDDDDVEAAADALFAGALAAAVLLDTLVICIDNPPRIAGAHFARKCAP